MENSGRLLVAAIDFGTTYSGYAFSFRSDYKRDPLSITALNFTTARMPGDSQERSLQTAKVPTCVLFQPDQTFHSFGYDAEQSFAKLGDDDDARNEAKKWYFFKQFKMKLHRNENLSKDMELLDHTGKKKLPAVKVFAAGIEYFKKHLEASLKQQEIDIRAEEIDWVLTVPAIWSDQARQFMREAAKQAGIADCQLSLALEPEAASLLCLEEDASTGDFDISGHGKKFLVADCGGGTIDMTAYEVCQGARLREICPPRGGAAAGKKVDDEFKQFLMETFGVDAISAFDNMETLNLAQEFEVAKRGFTEGNAMVAVKIPPSVSDSLEAELSKNPELTGKVSIVRKRLMVQGERFRDFFSKSIDCVVDEIRAVLALEAARGLGTALLVGGFSESALLRSQVAAEFPKLKLILPRNPAAAVLKGAVLFRHQPARIGWRASAFTYGVSAYEPFDPRSHDPGKKVVVEGEAMCRDVFTPFIRANDVVAVGHEAMRRTLFPVRSDQRTLVLPIYRSPKPDPAYVTSQDCQKLGEARVTLGECEGDARQRQVDVAMLVGGVELIVRATDTASGQQVTAVCDFLSK